MAPALTRTFAWLAGAIVAAIVLFAPRTAAASPTFCDARAVSLPPDVVAMCVALVNAGVDIPDDVAGFCDPTGASAIAPPPSLPVEGGTIGAADDCDGPTVRGAAYSSPGKNKSSRDATSHSDAATLGITSLIAPPTSDVVDHLSHEDAPLPHGFGRALERPPRH